MKIFRNIIGFASVIFLGYFVISYIDILANNLNEDGMIHAWNLFSMFRQNIRSRRPGRCTLGH